MANNQNGKNMSTGGKVGIGAGLAALAAAAAGAYYFYGSKDAGKNRKALRGWMVKAKGEVMERMENLKDLSEENYNKVVDQVMDKYKKVKKIDPAELTALAAEMRGTWKKIQGSFKQPAKKKPAKRKAPARK